MKNQFVVMGFMCSVFTTAFALLFKVSQQCSKNLCFTWSVTADRLILTCRAHFLVHSVYIFDQFGHLEADCLPPFPNVKCQEFVNNSTITQNLHTNETVYTVLGNIDTHLNGNWTCRHGYVSDIAHVQVTILKIKENIQETTTVQDVVFQRNECMIDSLLWSSTSYFLTIFVVMVVLSFSKRQVLCVHAICKRCTNRVHHNNVYRFQTVFLCCFTLSYFGLIVSVTFNSDRTCSSKVIFAVFGLVFGIVFGCLCIGNRDAITQDPTAEVMIQETQCLDEADESSV